MHDLELDLTIRPDRWNHCSKLESLIACNMGKRKRDGGGRPRGKISDTLTCLDLKTTKLMIF